MLWKEPKAYETYFCLYETFSHWKGKNFAPRFFGFQNKDFIVSPRIFWKQKYRLQSIHHNGFVTTFHGEERSPWWSSKEAKASTYLEFVLIKKKNPLIWSSKSDLTKSTEGWQNHQWVEALEGSKVWSRAAFTVGMLILRVW